MNQIATIFILIFGFLSSTNIDKTKYPIPSKTVERLFYIQRNLNKNTIVYDANFDNDGNLIDKNPINVYWIRYEEDGRKMELRNIEKLFAYGVKCKADRNIDKKFNVKLVAYNKRELILIQHEPFKASINMLIDNKLSELGYMYIYADNSGFWPKVEYIELFGKDLYSGEDNYEKIIN